jgi:Cytochrome P460
VREKFSKPTDTKPEMLAVMIKREFGFNPDGGDWEFVLVNGAGTNLKLKQKQGDCLDCHRSQQDNDFVFPLK